MFCSTCDAKTFEYPGLQTNTIPRLTQTPALK